MPDQPFQRGQPRPLLREHVDLADAVAGQHLPGWQLCDRTLGALSRAMPGHGAEAALAKATAVNALYGTNVFAIVDAAQRVSEVLSAMDLGLCDSETVHDMAWVPKVQRRFVSFASKYAHFFIDAVRFPIFDSYAVQMVRLHLGRESPGGSSPTYPQFCDGFDRLAKSVKLDGDRRALDRYLWLAGIGRALRRTPKPPVNAEVGAYFQQCPEPPFLPPW